ncbi:ATP-binding cassette domain-containing protein [Microbacterium elymi]|uniref:ATP-binding cassette domain-containing protein n=1 Tax=Microbacterium elymi TaxID=2909587 RepID=UPI00338E3A2C
MRDEGTAIVFITHKLREVREVADRITVIRLGKVIGEASPTASNTELASMMVGRAVELTVHKDPPKIGTGGLEVRGLRVLSADGTVVVDGVDFDVRPGEVLAIAGVQGNGQTELSEAIVGLQERVEGSIVLDGTELVGQSVREVLDEGVGFVPEDRQEDGLVGTFSVAENLILDRSGDRAFQSFATIRRGDLDTFARDKIAEFDIRTQGPASPAGSLSGGNQQKVVIARELSRDLKLLLATQPTRGVDVGSIEFIHKRIVATRDAGVPVVVVSTELDEVAALADRIAVMYRGGIVGIVPADTPRDVLGLMMAGETPTEDAA